MNRSGSLGAAALGLVATVAVVGPATPTQAVDTDLSIDTTSIDFGAVDVGSSGGPTAVTLTNTGGDPFGPINIFGGAPPTAEFNASQNCQGTTLPAGGSCAVSYTFSPGAAGTFNDTSSFTVSETQSQSDGEDFSVSLTGVGVDATATTTTTTITETTTTTEVATTTTTETATTTTTTTQPSNNNTPAPTQPPQPTTPPVGSTTTLSTTTTTVPDPTWPLTGAGVAARPALVVKIDNVDAEPQAGLNQADIVFEEIVEGRATRFAAVFNSLEHNPVGPIRSARTQDVDLLLCLNDPALAYSGANADVNDALDAAGFELFTEGDLGFFRNEGQPEPHNLYANLSTLFPQLASSGDAVPVFQYAAPGQDVGGTPVAFAAMTVGSYDVRWDWDANQGVFLRSQLGSPHEVTDGQASTDSVVVLVVEYGESPVDGGPEARTVGTGRAVVYTDGRRIEGTWSRSGATDPFTLTSASGPILLAPGRTWVELVDAENNLTDG